MIEALFSQAGYVATKKMMDATTLRHEAIASNIANIETPNYKRIDIAPSFQSELNAAMGASDINKINTLFPELAEDATAKSLNHIGNNVQLESELMQLSQNTLAHTLQTQMVTGALLKLRLAITGRNS
jgi:flagellar basal-body rod protein FlgB